ncbi:alpha-amylase family glycosyl hydrolase [Azospirillum sp.]|uniref:alpha-amylase family glycosyl hydrolase n=1 Tax=Azospirillum sp. TaxID=34012 RepID=UPI002D5D44F7|nr:alpha-amylase family glycosyl hydrolase [Azospirillum sp.]HYD65344.1 alpha-amylase family glycosyl hydrolase [Azospirillum sp.]
MHPLARSLARPLVLALLLAPAAAGASGPAVTLNGDGGDSWTFDRLVEGTAAPDVCDEVLVASPGGIVPAQRDGARFFAEVSLHEGANTVRALCRRDGAGETASTTQTWTVRPRDLPKAWPRVSVTSAGLTLDSGRSEPAAGRAAPVVRAEWRARPGNPAPLFAAEGDVPLDESPATARRLVLQTPDKDGDYYICMRVVDALGREDSATALFRVRGGRAEAPDLRREAPAWMEGAVVYGVVPFLFGPRGLAEVTARLDAIAALGVTALWLSPVTGAPGEDFGYAVTDHFGVRDRYGSLGDVKALVGAAHARGLKVLMDFVPNHLAEQHPYHADAAARGPQSPYHDFFDRGADGAVTHYFDWTNLKNLNYDAPDVRRYMTEAFAFWVREVGIDGFRVDASWAVRERAPEFWPQLREELKRMNPDLLLLAESTARDPWYVRNGFDAAYDWTDQLGQWAWHDAFGAGTPTAARLRAALAHADPAVPVMRFLNNNDTGARFITRHGVERARLAATMLMTLPGLPLVYTGDEVGAAYEPYGAHKVIGWDDPNGFTGLYKRLIALRAGHGALRGRALSPVATSDTDSVLAYRRPGATPEEEVLVLLNWSEVPRDVALSPADAAALGGRLTDLLTGETLTVTGTVPVPALGARVLKRSAIAPQAAQR